MAALSPVAEIVRRHDPDRFFTALFAPSARREALFILYAFNHELARAREVVREPFMALIRLQWWREVIEGAHRRHEVAGPLAEALDAGLLGRDDLLAMIAGREAEADAIESVQSWRCYVLGTAGAVAVAAAHALAVPAAHDEPVRLIGAAYGAAGLLRSAGNLARQGRSLLPPARDSAPGSASAALATAQGRAWLEAGRSLGLPRAAIPAVLVGAFAVRDLRRSAQPTRPRGLGDRAAVVLAALRARV